MGDHIEEKASRETKEKKMTPLAEKAVKALRPEKKRHRVCDDDCLYILVYSSEKKFGFFARAERTDANWSSESGRRCR